MSPGRRWLYTLFASAVCLGAALMIYEMAIFRLSVFTEEIHLHVSRTENVPTQWYTKRSLLDFDDVRRSFNSEPIVKDPTWMKLMDALNQSMVGFRYPTAETLPTLRLPDGYYNSALAQDVRKPKYKLKHLNRFYSRLFVERKAVHVTIFGGSNTAGSGMGKSRKEERLTYNLSYAVRLEEWLNTVYPPIMGSHIVHNFARGAVGSCYFQLLAEKLADPSYLGGETDLFVLETSVNDILSKDLACFDSGSDFLKSCFVKPLSFTNCEDEILEKSQEFYLTEDHRKHMHMWCRKRELMEKYSLLQIDLSMLLNLLCSTEHPFQHAYDTAEMTLYATSNRTRSWAARERLLEFIANATEDQVRETVPLLTQGSYFSTRVHDMKKLSKHKEHFEEVAQAITTRLGHVDDDLGVIGDVVLLAPDRKHLGRWGHMLVAAELAIWFTWLGVSGPSALHESTAVQSVERNRTVWAAVTFDMEYYNKRSGNIDTNKHKPVDKNARLAIYPLRPTVQAEGWKLYDDAGMQKLGLITRSKVPRKITFKIPKSTAGPKDVFTVRLGYMKSYADNMARFTVDLHETCSNTHITTTLTGHHEEPVSVFVDTVVGVVTGANDIVLTVTSLPNGKANKVKLVGLYLTQSSHLAADNITTAKDWISFVA